MNQYKKCKCCCHTMASVYFTHKRPDCMECVRAMYKAKKRDDINTIPEARAYVNGSELHPKGGVK